MDFTWGLKFLNPFEIQDFIHPWTLLDENRQIRGLRWLILGTSAVIVFVVLGWSKIGKQSCTFLIKKEKEEKENEEKGDHALI